VSHLPIDNELWETFSHLWGDALAQLPPAERGPEIMSVLRHALGRKDRARRRDAQRTHLRVRLCPRSDETVLEEIHVARARALRPLVEAFARADGFTYEQLISGSKRSDRSHLGKRQVHWARHKATWALHRVAGESQRGAALAIGGRDRTCVIASIRKVDAAIAERPELEREIRRVAMAVLPARAARKVAA
jgi:hypothetical protein